MSYCKAVEVLPFLGRMAAPSRQRRFLQDCCEKKTTVLQAWVTEHLGMKNTANVSRGIHCMDLSLIEKRFLKSQGSLYQQK